MLSLKPPLYRFVYRGFLYDYGNIGGAGYEAKI